MSAPWPESPGEDDLPDFLDADDEAPPVAERADLTRLRQRLLGADLNDALQAIDELASAGHGELQVELTGFFYDRLADLDHAAIERVLDCLSTVGDGRCVRGMERVLHERWQHLNEHQAGRARHIVQRSRRGGRK